MVSEVHEEMTSTTDQSNTTLNGTPRQGLLTATFGFFIGFAGIVVYGPAADQFEQAMGLSGILLGILVAAPNLVGSLIRIPFGAWTDDVGARKPFLILFGLSIIGMAGLSAILVLFYPSGLSMELYPLIFLFGALSGCGIGAFSVGNAQTSYWYPADKQGTALAIYAGIGNTSPGVFTILIPVVIATIGLTQTYLLWLVLLILGTIIYAIYAVDPYYFQLRKLGVDPDRAERKAREHGQELFPSGDTFKSVKQAATIPRSWALVAMYFSSFGGFLALTVWFPTYWTSYHGISSSVAGALTAIGFIVLGAIIRIPGGILSDRIGGERTAILSFSIIATASLILMLSQTSVLAAIGLDTSLLGVSPWTITAVIGMVVLAAGIGVASAAVFQLLPQYVPDAVGGASGLVGGVGAFGGFVAPPLLGIFVDLYGPTGYALGFILFLLLALVGLLLSVSLYVIDS